MYQNADLQSIPFPKTKGKAKMFLKIKDQMSKAISQMIMQPESHRLIIDYIQTISKIVNDHIQESHD